MDTALWHPQSSAKVGEPEPCGIVIPGNFESASYWPVVFTHVDSPADLGFPVIHGLWYC